MPDPTLGNLHELDQATQARAYWLVRLAREAGYPVIITSARRTQAEQNELVRRGASRTTRSLHLLGRAFDIDLSGWHRDAVPAWFWWLIGPWAEQNLGLTWGGRWANLRDFAHFQL